MWKEQRTCRSGSDQQSISSNILSLTAAQMFRGSCEKSDNRPCWNNLFRGDMFFLPLCRQHLVWWGLRKHQEGGVRVASGACKLIPPHPSTKSGPAAPRWLPGLPNFSASNEILPVPLACKGSDVASNVSTASATEGVREGAPYLSVPQPHPPRHTPRFRNSEWRRRKKKDFPFQSNHPESISLFKMHSPVCSC